MAHTTNINPIPILVYHQIDVAPPKGAPFRSLCVAPDAFARQMRLLKWLGYQGLSMTKLRPYLSGERHGKVVGITFDDGYVNNLTHALPVLRQLGFSSTCYAVSQRLGQTNLWDAVNGVQQTPLMDASQLRQWVAGGQEVGAHTQTHVFLNQVEPSAAHLEVAVCRDELQQVTGAEVKHFCYPYGQYTADHVAMAKLAGFETATTTQRSRVWRGADPWQLPRVPVLRSTTLPIFWLKCATRYEDRRSQ